MSEDPTPSSAKSSEPKASLLDHLMELRSRLLRSVFAWLLIFIAMAPFADWIFMQLAAPLMAVFIARLSISTHGSGCGSATKPLKILGLQFQQIGPNL